MEKNLWTYYLLPTFLGMNADTCVSYCDMTSMDSYYSPSSAQGRDQQANPFRTFQPSDTKYSPTFLPSKGQAYGEKSRSPFQQECQSLDAPGGEGTFNKYHLFMQRPTCKTPPEGNKLHQDSGHNGALISCYGKIHRSCSNLGLLSYGCILLVVCFREYVYCRNMIYPEKATSSRTVCPCFLSRSLPLVRGFMNVISAGNCFPISQ